VKLGDGQIAQAVDHCDNDKIKTIKYLNKLKGQVRPLRRAPRGLLWRGKQVWREGRGTMMSSQMILVDWDIRSLEKCGVRDALSALLLRVTRGLRACWLPRTMRLEHVRTGGVVSCVMTF